MTAAELAPTGPRYQALGTGAGDLTRSASPTPTLTLEEPRLQAWLDAGYHGTMDYMARHGMMRARPHELLPGTLRVISVRMNYLPFGRAAATLRDPDPRLHQRYALGRDYHKGAAQPAQTAGERIERSATPCCGRRDKPAGGGALRRLGPILEPAGVRRALAGWASTRCCSTSPPVPSSFWEICSSPCRCPWMPRWRSGAVWQVRGLHQYLPHRRHHRPYVVDGRRCISYLTIE